jgi:hypothetical protein
MNKKTGKALWDLIEEKARKQEDVDDNWFLTMVDLGHPGNIGSAEYRLKNIVSHSKIEGTLYSYMEN